MQKDKPQREVWAVDLDKTAALYKEGDIDRFGHAYVGGPIEEMVRRIQDALAAGIEVFIFTARVSPSDDSFKQWLEATQSYEVILNWCRQHLGVDLPITNLKLRCFTRIIDDKADQVVPNTGVSVGDLLGAVGDQ
jgi:hypothetical protein